MTCERGVGLMQGKFNFPFYLVNVIIPEAVYTILVTCILYPIILKLNERLEALE